jgi:Right handed beta helix region
MIMSKVRFTLNVLAVVILTLTVNSMAHAQATRTWVSGVGDDVNPCSRTAPCKTFAGAISKTAAGGEISVLDPGGFGAITITKSITIDGGGIGGSILAAGTTGVIVNITATTAGIANAVTLRNLSINGATTGIAGVRVLSTVTDSSVHIENCVIFGFRSGNAGDNGRGIFDKRTAANSRLFVSHTDVRNNSAHGIQIGTDTGFISSVAATLDNVRSVGNTLSGAFLGGGSKVSIRNSVMNGNGNAGVQSSEQAGGTTETEITSSVLSHNGFGVFAGSGASLVRMGDVTITDNATSGVSISGGAVESFQNNNVRGNGGGVGGNTAGTGVGQQ